MPSYPRSRSYATPEEAFGITQRPLNDWFDAAASGMARSGPAFSQSFEDATLRNQQRELESEKLRRQLESEQAASAFLQRAAGEKPDALMQMIAEDPAILGSQDAPMIRDYIATRQQVQQQKQAQQPYSNKVLGPALMKQLPPEDQAVFAGFMEQGMEATEALQQVRKQKSDLVTQAERRKLALAAAEEGVDAADIEAAMASPDPDLYLAAAKGKAKRAGRGGDDEYSLKDLLDIRKSTVDEFGEVVDPDLKTWVDEQIKFKTVGKPPLVIVDEKASAATTKTSPAAEVTQSLPALPPAPPASDVEAAALKEEQQRGLQESQKQQLADAAWTGVKGTAAARGTQDAPDAIMNEAKAAIVGGEAKNPRAQRIAALARAFADGRDVQVASDRVTAGNLAGGMSVGRAVSPEMALLEELGYEPDAIVGSAPSRAGGPMRNITALEAARAILAEAADPFIKLKGAAQVATEDADEDPIINAALEKGLGKTVKTD